VDKSGSAILTMTTGVDPRQFRTMEITAEAPGNGSLHGTILLTPPDPVAATPGMSRNHPGRALSLILAALLGQSPPRRRSCCTSLLSSLRSIGGLGLAGEAALVALRMRHSCEAG
jgi:hypothetical protein